MSCRPRFYAAVRRDDSRQIFYYLTTHMKNAKETVIPGGTHFVQMEKFKKVNEEIETFMSSPR
ncbi:MAG: hypothetical protein CM1200mP22_30590 [Dehalococcoidia bacterium]|nr:MAG: hypothetical protein CM1200mP22_30590 [Dehalococcoidia bacterium]